MCVLLCVCVCVQWINYIHTSLSVNLSDCKDIS